MSTKIERKENSQMSKRKIRNKGRKQRSRQRLTSISGSTNLRYPLMSLSSRLKRERSSGEGRAGRKELCTTGATKAKRNKECRLIKTDRIQGISGRI